MKPGNGDTTAKPSHVLREINGIPLGYVDVLGKQWIETAEEVIALSGLPDGRGRLKSLLGIDDTSLSHFLGLLSELVGEKVSQRLLDARPGGPLGAILTEEQRKHLGLE